MVDVQTVMATVHADDDRQSNRHFAGGECDDKNAEHGTGSGIRSLEIRKRNEIHIRRIEHDFNRNQHTDHVPLAKHAADADSEKNKGEYLSDL